MTAEELIIEHFEGTLSLEQEGELTTVLASSPDARAMYDRYLRIDDVLAGDAVATAPSSALDERVMAAALGAIGGTIGGGSAGWISGKIAAAFSVVAVGGLSIFLLVPNDPDPASTVTPPPASVPQAPVVTPAPAVVDPDPAVVEPVVPAESQPAAAGTSSTSPRIDRTPDRRPTAASSVDTEDTKRDPEKKPGTTPSLNLGGDAPTVIDNGEPRIDPERK